MKLPRCPRERCGGKSREAGNLFMCVKCGALHDGHPDEGGDFSDRDPSARLQRQERVKPPTRARTSW
jgi:hypothetical protein